MLITLAGFGFAAVTALHGYLLAQTDSSLQAVLPEYKLLILRPDSAPPSIKGGNAPAVIKGGQESNGKSRSTGKQRHITNPVKPVPGNPGSSPGQIQLPAVLDKYYIGFAARHGPAKGIVVGNADLVPRLPAALAALAAGHAQTVTVTSVNGRAQLRLLAASTGDGRTIIIATSLGSVNSTVSRLQLIVIIGSLAAAVVVFAGVGLVVRRGLRPVESMADAADRITAGDLAGRVSPHDPATEVGRLGAALNGMLARIQASVREREASEEATRRFFADASHELRTPLASLRANAELYQQGALPRRPQVDEAMRRITAEARRMGALVDDMLKLARLDQHPRQPHQPVDLTALASECAERARIATPQHTWQPHIAPGLVTTGDEEMLRRAIDNLLANVAAHTPAGTTATLTAAARDGIITVEVSDTGPGVPPGQLPRIFDRFYRAPSQTHRPGSGLGLAIVAAIIAAHHGTAQATPNLPHGLRITLALPASSQSRPAQPPPASTAPSPHLSSGWPLRTAR
jgi:two-component system OmpR family sensor kinase